MAAKKADVEKKLDGSTLCGSILAVIPDLDMEKDRLQKLIDGADDRDKITLKVLYNAVVENLKTYNASKTAARLKDWRDAESALKATIQELEAKYFPTEQPLPNLLAVVDWLKNHGWKVSKSKVYADAKAGRISARPDGSYSLKSVQTYAGNCLKQKGSAGQRDEMMSGIATDRAKAEADKLRHQADMAELKLRLAQGKFVQKDYFDIELSKRAAIFRSDLEGLVRSKASDIVSLVTGNPTRIPELIEYLLLEVEHVLARYSEDRPVEVPVVADVRDDDDEEGNEEEG